VHPLLLRQLRKAFGAEIPDAGPLRALIAAVGDAYASADDDRRQLEHSLELASDELYQRNRTLEHQLETLTRLEQAVDRRNRDMTLILDNVAQGLVTVGLDGVIRNECSLALIRWFGPVAPHSVVWSLLFGHDPELAAWMQLGFETLRSETMPLDVTLGRLPAELSRDGRAFRIEYRPIGEPLSALLVVVSDITDELARARQARIQHELVAVFHKAVADRAGFLAFVAEADTMVARCTAADTSLSELRFQVHTLKGNAAMFKVATIVELCERLERHIVDEAVAPERRALDALVAAWREFHARIDPLVGLGQRDTVTVDREEYRAALALLGDRDPAAARIRRWGLDPARSHLERFADQARQLAERLGKPEPDIEIQDADVHVERDRFAPLWSALIHAVRNAVDHGIEPGDDRIAAGKSWQGKLVLRTAASTEQLVVEVEDDGAGVDWDAIAARARELGGPDQGADAVFAVGVSTAGEIGEVSGCGVGMGSLRSACVALGGRVDLLSRPGGGTTVRCLVPLRHGYPRSIAAGHYT